MRLLVTGLNGTLAPVLARRAAERGIDVIGWDRAAVDPSDMAASAHWMAGCGAKAIAHLAMGSPAWAAALASHAARAGLPFVFTSTAMVFDHQPDGPHDVSDERSARDDYGRYKIACEDAVLTVNPQAMVARIGWQIDPDQPGNNMLMHLDQRQQREGCVAASRAWRPACSFMADTADALLGLLAAPQAGVHHLDSNADESHSFDCLVAALKQAFGRDTWQLRVHEDYRHDQRLVGGPTRLPPLSARLSTL